MYRLKLISCWFILSHAVCIFLQDQAWLTAFKKYDLASIARRLGYDPAIALINPDQNVEYGDAVTVYAHAWGDSKDSIYYFRNNSLMLPGTIIGFNFKDAHKGSSLPDPRHSNFAQEGDISTLLLVLKMLVECGLEKVKILVASSSRLYAVSFA